MNTLEHAAEAYAEGDIARSREIARTCLSYAREKGDRSLEANALWRLAQVGMVFGDVTRALAEAQRASAVFESLGDREGETRSLIAVAYAATQLRENGLAVASGQRALLRSQALRHPALQAAANNYLGVALFWDGDSAAADGRLRAASDLSKRMPGANLHVRPMVNRATGALVHLTFGRVFAETPPDPSQLAPLVDELNGCNLAGAMPFLSAGFQLDCEAIAAWPSFFAACWQGDLTLARECLALCESRAQSRGLALRWIGPYVKWAEHEYAFATGRWEHAVRAAGEMVEASVTIQNRQLVWLGSALKLRALEAYGLGNGASRGWKSLIWDEMQQRRALRTDSAWLEHFQHDGGQQSKADPSWPQSPPLFDSRTATQRKLEDWKRRHALTPAECQVLGLLAQGIRVKEIARRREASVGTVRVQVKALFDKTGFNSQQRLIAEFFRAGDEAK